MATAPDALVVFHAFLAKPGARDKLGRFIQYGTRILRGVINEYIKGSAPGDHAALRAFLVKNQSLMFWLMHSRRTFRWFKSTAALLALRRVLLRGGACPWGEGLDRKLFVVSRLLLVAWHLGDHTRWLTLIKWLPGGNPRMASLRRFSFGCFSIAQFLTTVHHLPRAFPGVFHHGGGGGGDGVPVSWGGGGRKSVDTDPEAVRKARRACLKAALCTLTFCHVSELAKSHDVVCGVAAMVTSWMDMMDLWPSEAEKLKHV